MELQLQRQQAQAQRQTLDRLARRPPATSAPAQVTLVSVSSSPSYRYPINLLELLISGSAKLSHPGNIKLKQQCEAGRDEHPHLLQLPLGRADRGGWDGGGNEGGRRGESHLHWRTSLGSSLDTVRRFPPILRLHADY